jgi:serine/threonine protein kinase
MDQERWLKAKGLLHAALDREPEERRAFLDTACRNDAVLRREIELLLEKGEEAGSFLQTPAMGYSRVWQTTATTFLGRQFGPYQIISAIGAGGMGEVYRAHDSKLGRDVAVKMLPPEFAGNPERLARFRREARTLASLNHPNIGAIYGLEESVDADCLVLELVEGETLRGLLPIAEALRVAKQITEALQAAQEKGIVHRDLKPANIKITPDGRVKVLDFGLAKAVLGVESGHDLSQATAEAPHTLTGHIHRHARIHEP